ncbi:MULTISPECIES: carbohydrate kinase family protein [unclassified Pseudomonas]|uniref:carbohydrate kinase family protein n=1 Tax=unclassified Pseudomonas TaxID=196821 RepID=UPI0025D44A19|nr:MULTISPECIES: PfkB family carbohydrate kinase [unclassified Pseudomonas]
MTRTPPVVVFTGVCTLDTIAQVERYPDADQRVAAKAIITAGGGPAATAAVTCARLGIKTRFIGVVGDDGAGAQIRQDLEMEGVLVDSMLSAPGQASGVSVIVCDSQAGTRSICNRPGPQLDLASHPLALLHLREADWVHVDQSSWRAFKLVSSRAKLSVDAGNPIPGFDPASADLFAPTLLQLRATYGDLPAKSLLKAAIDQGARWVVATAGEQGSMAIDAEGNTFRVPAFTQAPLISTLGAGDVFHGALLAARLHGLSPVDSVRYANVTAALSCRGIDGRSAIPTHAEVMDLLSSLPVIALEETL